MKTWYIERSVFIFFLFLVFMGQCFYQYNIWSLLFLLWAGRKLFQYHKLSVKMVFIIGILVAGRLVWDQMKMDRQISIDVLQIEDVWIETNPLNIRIEDNCVYGLATLLIPNHDPINTRIAIPIDLLQDSRIETESLMLKAKISSERIEGARNFNVFDYQKFARLQHLFWKSEVTDVSKVQRSHSFHARYHNLRAKLLHPLRRLDSYSLISLQNMIFFNLSSNTYRNMKETFSRWGILHFFAISGFHISLIIKILDKLLRKFTYVKDSVPWAISVVLALYGCLIGWPVGAIRAIGCYYIKLLTKSFYISLTPLDQVSVIGILMLMVSPTWSCHLGYLLSFFMTFTLKFFQRDDQNHGLEINALCVMLSWPLTINNVQQWHPGMFLVLVVFAYFFEKILLPMISITFIGSLFFPDALEKILQRISSLSTVNVHSNHIFSRFQSSFTNLFISNVWMAILVVSIIAVLWIYHFGRKKTFWLCFFVMHIFLINIPYFHRISGKVTMIDVGQGDAMLVQPGMSSSNWLIDTGGRMEWNIDQENNRLSDVSYAERTIIPALRGLNVDHLDGIIITHPDLDHMGNLSAILQQFPVNQIIISPQTSESKEWKEVVPFINDTTTIRMIEYQQKIILNETIHIYNVSKGHHQDDSNANSLITTIHLGQVSIINMADAPKNLEKELLKVIPNPSTAILKLGHHGSHTSSSKQILEGLTIQGAWISVGKNNHYGHPHQEVIDRVQSYGIPIWMTSEKGAIQLSQNIFGDYQIHSALE